MDNTNLWIEYVPFDITLRKVCHELQYIPFMLLPIATMVGVITTTRLSREEENKGRTSCTIVHKKNKK